MPSRSSRVRLGVELLLILTVAGLSYWLYRSLTAPYDALQQQRAATEQTRRRMARIRTEMARYRAEYERYPSTLDSLVRFIEQDPSASIPDSLPYSPRTGRPFILFVRDSAGLATYLLKDPDSNDQIGTLTLGTPRPDEASWE